MFKSLKKAGLAAGAVGVLAAGTSAQARDGYYYRHHDDTAAAAIAGGVIGLALGAAIASDNGPRYYYPRGYYYGPPPRVYYYDYPRTYYYRTYPRAYYYPRYDYRYYRGDGRWDRGRHRGWRY